MPAVLADRTGAGVIGGQGEFGRAECAKLHQQIARSAIEVLDRITRIDAEKARGTRHELSKPHRAGRGVGSEFEPAFDLNHRMEVGVPVPEREACGTDRGMGCIPRCGCRHHVSDRRRRLCGHQHRADQCGLVTWCSGMLGIILGAREDIAGRASVQNEASALGENISARREGCRQYRCNETAARQTPSGAEMASRKFRIVAILLLEEVERPW